MTSAIWTSCLPIINSLKIFLAPEKGVNAPHDFRATLVKQFEQFEKSAASIDYPKHKIDDIRYALAAFADECVMHSDWKEKVSWMRCSLQLQFFGEHSAGEGFFRRLSHLRQQGVVAVEVLEIYFLCLVLGFKGYYRFDDTVQWETFVTGLENQIVLLRGKSEWDVSPVSEASVKAEQYRDIPLWWIALVTVGIIFFICVVYSIATQFQLTHAVNRLNTGLIYVS